MPSNLFCADCGMPFEVPANQEALTGEDVVTEFSFDPVYQTSVVVVRVAIPRCPVCSRKLGVNSAIKRARPKQKEKTIKLQKVDLPDEVAE